MLNVTGRLLNSSMITSMQPLLQVSFVEPGSCRMGPTYTAKSIIAYLHQLFKIQIIFLKTDYAWAAHNPGLHPLYFLSLWNYQSVFLLAVLQQWRGKNYSMSNYVQQVTAETLRKMEQVLPFAPRLVSTTMPLPLNI